MSENEPGRKKPKKLTFEEAKLKAASFCAYQERHQQEVRDKLYSFGLTSNDVEELLGYLISEGFINEERFARAFAGGKFRIKKWGKVKIEYELARRKISPYCIGKAFEEIDDKQYRLTIANLIDQKRRSIASADIFKQKTQIANYVIRKGFEAELVWDIINDKFSSQVT